MASFVPLLIGKTISNVMTNYKSIPKGEVKR